MANRGPSPSMIQMQQHGPLHGAPSQPPPPAPHPGQYMPPSRQIGMLNESVWIAIGNLQEQLGDVPEAMGAYERALRANQRSIPAMTAISLLLRSKEEFHKAVEFLQTILAIDKNNGEAWGSLGHCYLMMDDLEKAHMAYQNAVANPANVREPKLWYGIGILYDRHGSLEHAEEAFSQVMQMQPDFEKANEVYFRLGIIYKQQQKYPQSLECFKYIVNTPPHPLTEEDIWFQIGHVYEQHKDYENAKAAYLRVLEREPNHAKVLQQLGWLYHQASQNFQSQERAIEYLEKSVNADQQDAQSWYLLGRCYMSQQKYPKAYEAYQQAVYRDGRNSTFWCSIGVLYYQINQYRDALDAYSRAIRLNPYIAEVWYDLGTLYESCNNQINDAIDAYQRAAELDPSNHHIKTRLSLLRSGGGGNGAQGPPAPQPTDVHPQAYPPSGPLPPQWQGSAPVQPQGPPAAPGGWQGRLSEVNPPPQPPNPYDSRADYRGLPPPGGAPPMVRPPSPRQDQQLPLQYQDPIRPGPGPAPGPLRREPTPPPPQLYQQGLPPQPPSRQANQPPQMQTQNYPGPASMGRINGPAPPNPLGHFRGTNSPRTDVRPLHDSRMPSPKSAYPQHPPPPPTYGHHPEQGPQPVIEAGPPPPPPQSVMAPEGILSRVDDRPASVGPKRMREWDDEPLAKKQANDENRARLEDLRHRRPSTPPRNESYRRNSSEARRFDEQRRAEEMRRAEEQRHVNENYHPSEAAHHPPSHLPPMQQGPPGPMQGILHDGPPAGPGPSPVAHQKEFHKDERPPMDHPSAPRPAPSAAMNEPERAARKMDVDENYDDAEEDEKKVPIISNGPSAVDKKASTPTTTTVNGVGPKAEPA